VFLRLTSAEDDAADTIRPRLDAAEADVSRVHRVKAVKVTLNDGSPSESVFSLDRDVEKLDEAIGKIPSARLLVIDPVNAYMGKGIDTHRDAEVRQILAPLAELASRRRVAVVGVMHLKKGDAIALHRVSGSIGFVAAARIVWGFGEDPDTENRVMVAVKNNLAPLGYGLAYRIEAKDDTPRIVWQQGAVTLDAHAVLSVEPKGREGRGKRRNDAEAWLLNLLSNGEEVPVSEIIEAGRKVDFSWSTIERVKKSCGLRAVKRGRVWCWVLA